MKGFYRLSLEQEGDFNQAPCARYIDLTFVYISVSRTSHSAEGELFETYYGVERSTQIDILEAARENVGDAD